MSTYSEPTSAASKLSPAINGNGSTRKEQTVLRVARHDLWYVDAARIDAEWQEVVTSDHQVDGEVWFDLDLALYIDQEALPFLLAVVSHRAARGTATRFILPQSKRMLQFLDAWNFVEALEHVAGTSIENIIDAKSFRRLTKARADPTPYIKLVEDPLGGTAPLLPVSFFALTKLNVKTNDPKIIAGEERARWLDRHVVAVLDNYLKNFGSRVGSRIVYEAVLNAASHPRAKTAYSSSQLLTRSAENPNGNGSRQLVISIWDDGLSFAETLADGLRNNGTLSSPSFGLVEEEFELTVIDRASRQAHKSQVRSTNKIPVDELSPELLVLGAFFLGITSTPHRDQPETDADQDYGSLVPVGAVGHRGLGLYLIRRAVIDQFGGTLQYISGHYRLRLSQGSENIAGAYHARFEQLTSTDAFVRGNCLVIRIPLGNIE